MLHKGSVVDKVEGFEVIDCKGCKFKHVNPIPSEKELGELYSSNFYSKKKANYFKDSEEDIDWWKERYKFYLKLIKRHTKGRKLLDIGCGPGYFSRAAIGSGFTVTGLEPSSEAAKYASGLGVEVINDFFADHIADELEGKYDVISMILVLEHIPNPLSFLKRAYRVLKSGGLLFVISPNDYSHFQLTLKQHLGFQPWWVSPLQHINYFDINSIQKLLSRIGLNTVELTTTFPMEFFILSGEDYTGNSKLGRECHNKRKTFEHNLIKNPELFESFYRSLAEIGLGREFVVIAKK